MDSVASLAGVPNTELNNKINSLSKENVELKKAIDGLRNLVVSLQARVESLESNCNKPSAQVSLKTSFLLNIQYMLCKAKYRRY